jgi:uncharacterized protein YjiS (DUF1127 family)
MLRLFPRTEQEAVMPALTAFAIAAARRASRRLRGLAERIRNRRETMRLASLDDRMLADIGLSRCDLRDAFAGLPWHDPSAVLECRAAERRRRRPIDHDERRMVAGPSPVCYPPTDRPARYTV